MSQTMDGRDTEGKAQRANGGDPGGNLIPLTAIRPSSPSKEVAARLDVAAIRERLAGARGRRYWQSLEELSDTEEFRQYVEREFPLQAPREMLPVSRREFLRVMGASLALAGLAGCSYQPHEKIVPYVEQPELLVPGKPLFYTTAFQRGGYAYGLLAESHMGRPTKLEGNPDHPASQGATDAMTQASLLTLYDPDRSQSVRNLGTPTTWNVFLGAMSDFVDALRRNRGAGLRLVMDTITSPTLADQLRRLLKRYPEAKIHFHEPVGQENVRTGSSQAFGQEVNPVYHFDKADTILSLDSNFLMDEPGSVRYARDFVKGRMVREGRTPMNRLYVVESTPTITGANADHRLALRASRIEGFARAVAAGLGVAPAGGAESTVEGVPATWVSALVDDLKKHAGTSLVIAGAHQPPEVHALAFAMNSALGNIGKTVTFTAPVEVHFGPREGTLAELVSDLNAGRVEVLVILGGNPAYTAPAELDFAGAVQKFNTQMSHLVPAPDPRTRVTKPSIHLGLYDDETGVQCQWHIPESHYLEAWSDARAYDGTASIVQPLILPLYSTRSKHELLAILLGEGDRSGYEIVREYWSGQKPGFTAPAAAVPGAASTQRAAAAAGTAGAMTGPTFAPPTTPAFEEFWRAALLAGTIPGTAAPPQTVGLKESLAAGGGQVTPAGPSTSQGGLEISFRPDPTIWDGRYANNGWLQELPKPITSLTWDNALMVSPRTAEAQHLTNGDLVELSYRGRRAPAPIPVWILPGQPDDSVTLHLGYGRTWAGRLGGKIGANAYALRSSEGLWFGSGVEIRRVGGGYPLAVAQRHSANPTYSASHGLEAEERGLIREGTFEEYSKDPKAPRFLHREEGEEGEAPPPSLYPPVWPSDEKGVESGPAEGGVGDYPDTGYNGLPIPAWGMVIDLTACIGCGACTIACQAENNIATVGKDQVLNHRQMHWIRIDNYFKGELDEPETVFQPVPCMHCEKAPCEPVCPVEATTHSAEGINEQTYNRCVGTRYCQNNCPYKVRRFNYFQYSDQQTPTIQMMTNPDVTVRSRGVMEKCTYCIQRINEARIQAEKEERPIRDGDVVTACAQVCPTQAIVFGNINDTHSRGGQGSEVRRQKLNPLNYAMLTELNTRPRTSYLAKLRNPNPDLKA